MRKKLNVKTRVVMGLAGITVSLVMLAFYLGVISDQSQIVRESRAALAEAIAVHATALVTSNEFPRLARDFKILVERNADLLSLALRRSDGRSLIGSGGHDEQWERMEGEYSRETQVRVPIWAGEHKWGQLELRFKALQHQGILGILDYPIVRLTLFMGGLCFVVFYFYIGKVLRHLDPSKAIPGRVRSALDTLAGGLLVLDHKEQIVLANKAFAALLQKSPDDLLGHRAGDLPWIAPDGGGVAKSERPWIQALAQGTVQANRILRLKLADRDRLTFSINCSPVLGAGGKFAGVLVSFDDVTQLEKKEIELRRSKEEAETANQAKSVFLANMSHEIRTPMTAILGFTEILKRGYDRDKKDSLRYLDTIHSSGHNLLELINDILDLSKVESGRLEIEKVRTEPHLIINDVLQVLNIKAKEKGLALRFEARGTLPQQITTDPSRLRQIILNLVGNAIKFTEEGEVRVGCRLDSSAGDPRLVIEVVDTGVGIAPEKIDAIFDPFTQADASVTRHFGGTGLGLSISRKFARALGGDITVKSIPGQGSIFRVTLATGDLQGVPLLTPDQVDAASRASRQEDSCGWQFPKAAVLVVDDGAENRELIRLFLEQAGAVVAEAENGQAGVEKALAKDFDVILMDVNMPVLDGFSATRELRERGLETPIIALTANAMKGFEQECLKAGFSGYFSKPIDIGRFMKVMAGLLGGKAVPTATDGDATPLEAQGGAIETVPAAGPPPIVADLPINNERLRNLAARFIARFQERLKVADNDHGKGQWDDVAAFAHWLKGAGGSVGFHALTEPASKLEQLAKSQYDAAAVSRVLHELQALADRLAVSEDGQRQAVKAPGANVSATAKPVAANQPASSATMLPLVSRLAGNQRLHGVIQRFIDKLDGELKTAETALSRGDLADLVRIAHWLKGAGGTVGYDAFTKPAARLEALARSGEADSAGQELDRIKTLSGMIVAPTAASDGATDKAARQPAQAVNSN